MSLAPSPPGVPPAGSPARAARALDLLLMLPLSLVVILLVRGLASGKEDPSILLARLRAAHSAAALSPASFIPGPAELPGLRERTDVQVYTAETLYDLIDGGAELFLRLGCKGAVSATLRFTTGEEVLVEAFDMGSSESALTIWKSERGPEAQDVNVAGGAYADRGALRFHHGSSFVRLAAVPTTERTAEILLDSAVAIAKRMP